MLKSIKSLIIPDATAMAAQLLAEARLDMLKAQAAKEYWNAQVDMLHVRLGRLNQIVKSNE